jgi:hypothetical protein
MISLPPDFLEVSCKAFQRLGAIGRANAAPPPHLEILGVELAGITLTTATREASASRAHTLLEALTLGFRSIRYQSKK